MVDSQRDNQENDVVDRPLPSSARHSPTLRDYLIRLDDNYSALHKDFKEWRYANREDRKGIYQRLNELEARAGFIPNAQEAELLKEVADYYRAKRKFRERMYTTLAEKGILGVVAFIGVAVLFYIQHLLTKGS